MTKHDTYWKLRTERDKLEDKLQKRITEFQELSCCMDADDFECYNPTQVLNGIERDIEEMEYELDELKAEIAEMEATELMRERR